jgi:hypothetical protein
VLVNSQLGSQAEVAGYAPFVAGSDSPRELAGRPRLALDVSEAGGDEAESEPGEALLVARDDGEEAETSDMAARGEWM